MKKILKIIGIVLAVIILLPILVFAMMHLFSSDIDPIDDSDLMISVELPTEDENAYFYLKEANGEMIDEYNVDEVIAYLMGETGKVHYGYVSGEGLVEDFDLDNVAKFLDLNVNVLAPLYTASDQDIYQDPQYANLEELSFMDIRSGFSKTHFARIFAVEALYEFADGREDKAVKTCFKMLKISKMIHSSKGMAIEKLMAHALHQIMLPPLEYILENGEFSEAELKLYQDKLSDYRLDVDDINDAYRLEYVLAQNYVDRAAEIDEPNFLGKIFMNHDFYFQPEATKEMLADNYRGLINGEGFNEEEFRANAYFSNFFVTKNAIGKATFASVAPSIDAGVKLEELNVKYDAVIDLIDEKLSELESEDPEKVPVKRKD